MSGPNRPIERARMIAASFLDARGQQHDAQAIRTGGGDDFAEVQIALSAVRDMLDRTTRLEAALATYADPGFWDPLLPEAALAFHDNGEIARAALAGKELFAIHRD